MAWRLAVDIGGTFTDIVALEEESGAMRLAKVPSTPSDPADGFINGIDHITSENQISPAGVAAVFHGTTVATNALVQRRGGKVVYIDDIYDEFSAGRRDPKAVARFMATANKRWARAPRDVLLLGKSSVDGRDRMGMGDNHLPLRMADSPWGAIRRGR